MNERRVVGVWLVRNMPVPCTRSIEEAFGRFYVVSRMLDEEGKQTAAVNGSRGLPVERVSPTEYRSATGTTYLVQDDGGLLSYQEAEVLFEASPHKELWPA